MVNIVVNHIWSASQMMQTSVNQSRPWIACLCLLKWPRTGSLNSLMTIRVQDLNFEWDIMGGGVVCRFYRLEGFTVCWCCRWGNYLPGIHWTGGKMVSVGIYLFVYVWRNFIFFFCIFFFFCLAAILAASVKEQVRLQGDYYVCG